MEGWDLGPEWRGGAWPVRPQMQEGWPMAVAVKGLRLLLFTRSLAQSNEGGGSVEQEVRRADGLGGSHWTDV